MHTAMLRRASAARLAFRSCTRKFELHLRQQYQSREWQSTASTPSAASIPSPASRNDIYDVVCVGGGPAGLSLLTALRANPVTAGLRLALVEAQDLGPTRAYAPAADRYANRCSSLTPASARFLNSIGAWAHLHRDRVQPYHAMQVWDGVTDARIDFDWPPGAALPAATGSTIAYMVENSNLTAALLRRLDELGGVDVFDGARVNSIGFGEEGLGEGGEGDEGDSSLDLSQWPAVQVSERGGASPRTVLARLLVGADGANSPVRAFADIPARGWDYERHGVVATLLLGDPSGEASELPGERHAYGLGSDGAQRTAYQRFLSPAGPVALLPLPGRFATLVWSTTPARAALLKSLGPEDFVAMVNAAFRLRPVDLAFLHTMEAGGQRDEVAWRMDNTAVSTETPPPVIGVQSGSVASFPLRMRHADTYVGERVALVGDAAHTVHPLAGQGLNQGQADVESLARTLAYAVKHGQDVGVRASLAAYEAERYATNHVLLGVCDKLHKLYAAESAPVVALRSLGLRAIDALRPVKTLLMRQAAGGGL